MGITDFFSDLLSSVSFVQEVHAEAPAEDEEASEGSDESKDEEGGDDAGGEEEGGDDEAGEEEAEEEEEEEEPVDPKPALEEGTYNFIYIHTSDWRLFQPSASIGAESKD